MGPPPLQISPRDELISPWQSVYTRLERDTMTSTSQCDAKTDLSYHYLSFYLRKLLQKIVGAYRSSLNADFMQIKAEQLSPYL